MEAYYSLVGLSQDLKRSFELLEILLPAFFSNATSVYQDKLRLEHNQLWSFLKDTSRKLTFSIHFIEFGVLQNQKHKTPTIW